MDISVVSIFRESELLYYWPFSLGDKPPETHEQ
jgi:hypothetical protein